jgi:hypothetical protein
MDGNVQVCCEGASRGITYSPAGSNRTADHWTLAWPGVAGAIVGAHTPSQVDGWIRAASIVLAEQDLAEIAAAIQRTSAGTGPADPARVRLTGQQIAR